MDKEGAEDLGKMFGKNLLRHFTFSRRPRGVAEGFEQECGRTQLALRKMTLAAVQRMEGGREEAQTEASWRGRIRAGLEAHEQGSGL